MRNWWKRISLNGFEIIRFAMKVPQSCSITVKGIYIFALGWGEGRTGVLYE